MTLRSDLSTEQVIDLIFKDPEVKYGLSEFDEVKKKPHEILEIYPKAVESGRAKGEVRYYLKCLKRGADVQVYSEASSSPEEIVRQLYLHKLRDYYGYPLSRMDVEKEIWFGSGIHEKPADIVVYQPDGRTAYIVVEVKQPKRQDGLEQLKSYLNAEGSPIGVWVNGTERVILYRPYPREFEDTLTEIPRFDQTIDELLETRLSLDHLKREFDFRGIVLTLEELVLANSGEDEFQEIFKIIFAKLYDEYAARERRDRELYFRKAKGAVATYGRIERLFEQSVREWPGIFEAHERIRLTANHLQVCIGPLERVQLLGANMRVMDDAFEYLITKVAKGEKGQFFTPRYVIDMCVKMLNPKKREYVIDPACGSSGFLLHALNWVRDREFGGDEKEAAREYGARYLYGIDFDHRMAKIARALMLIAGDGKSHVFKLNSLDPREWMGEDDELVHARSELQNLAMREERARYGNGWDLFPRFRFDTLMTNPPFAGEIRDSQLLRHYDLATKPGKNQSMKKVERHVLFIERSLQFLRAGGRMAIVLPQGILNNTSLQYIRDWVMQQARIVAVVGLHPNAFKPHTGTKTSVLFLQKWGPSNPSWAEYPIFMAVSQEGGKDSSGDYLVRRDEHGNVLTDTLGNPLILQDCVRYLETDEDGVAEAFVAFAKEQGLEFWRDD